MSVEERKQQARHLEQQGEFEDARVLYEEIISDLQGTPEMWQELPLCVKAGDLSLKMGDASDAISHYEKAAQAYAAYGSSKSVIALCTKILRVNPGRTHVFLRLVRRMIERDHLSEARLVLEEYTDRLKLPKARAVLDSLANNPDEHMKPVLEMLLELGGRYEYARAQGRDHQDELDVPIPGRVVEEIETEPVSLEPASASNDQPDNSLSENSAEVELQEQPEGVATEAEVSETPTQEAQPETAGEESAPASSLPGEGDIEWVDARRLSAPRASQKVLFNGIEQRRNVPKGLWIGLVVVVVVIVGALALVLFGVIPLGGDDSQQRGLPASPAQEVELSDSALMAGADPEGATEGEGGETAPAETPSEAAVDERDAEAAAETPAQPTAATTADEAGAPEAETVEATPSPEEEEVALPPSRGVIVQGLEIVSTEEFTSDGRVGYRVLQTLDTGEQLAISASYYGDEIDAAPGSEDLSLAPLIGDTTTAIIRFAGYAVELRAITSAFVLESLVERLSEVPQSN